jgi:hypothetical protein
MNTICTETGHAYSSLSNRCQCGKTERPPTLVTELPSTTVPQCREETHVFMPGAQGCQCGQMQQQPYVSRTSGWRCPVCGEVWGPHIALCQNCQKDPPLEELKK